MFFSLGILETLQQRMKTKTQELMTLCNFINLYKVSQYTIIFINTHFTSQVYKG